MPNTYLTIPISIRRCFGAWEAVQKGPIHFVVQLTYYEIRKAKKDKVQCYPVGARSLEGLGTLDRLGLEGLLLFMYPNFIL